MDEIKAAVFNKQKTLAEIYTLAGKQSLFDYVSTWELGPASENAKAVSLVMERLLERIYPANLVKEVVDQFTSTPLVSTIDHNGILNHPFFLNSNLIFSLRPQKYLICLSTSGVSLNNSSWPACLVFNGADGNLKRFSFFPSDFKTKTVLAAPPLQSSNVEKIISQIKVSNDLTVEQKNKLQSLVEEIFAEEKIFECDNFSDQACLISSHLWSKIFPSAPKLIYLPVEDVVTTLLQGLANEKNFLNHLIFTEQGWHLLEKYFTGMQGAFFENDAKGSFLFWGLDEQGSRVHLKRSDLEPENILKDLAARKIYPTSLVCFLALLYYGVTCAGGFNQVNWLTEIKEKFVELLKEAGENEIADIVIKVPTKNFAEGELAVMERGDKQIKATGIDLYLSGKDYYQEYINLSKQVTLAKSIEDLLPEIYKIITPANERKVSTS